MNLPFRVWDTVGNCFIYHDKGYQGHYIIDLKGKFHNLQNGEGGAVYEIQQATGIKDIDGKMIFEGDVIEWKHWVGDFAWEFMSEQEASWHRETIGKTYHGVVCRDLLIPCNMDVQSYFESDNQTPDFFALRKLSRRDKDCKAPNATFGLSVAVNGQSKIIGNIFEGCQTNDD